MNEHGPLRWRYWLARMLWKHPRDYARSDLPEVASAGASSPAACEHDWGPRFGPPHVEWCRHCGASRIIAGLQQSLSAGRAEREAQARALGAMEAEAANLRRNAKATRDGIAAGVYPTQAEPIAMAEEIVADSFERVVRAARGGT